MNDILTHYGPCKFQRWSLVFKFSRRSDLNFRWIHVVTETYLSGMDIAVEFKHNWLVFGRDWFPVDSETNECAVDLFRVRIASKPNMCRYSGSECIPSDNLTMESYLQRLKGEV